MGEFLLDTTVLIDHLAGKPETESFLNSRPRAAFSVHAVAMLEVLVGARDASNLRSLRTYLDQYRTVLPSPADFRQCAILVRTSTLAHRVGWPDCLIAATALRLNLAVITLNDRHFTIFRRLRVVRPY